MATNNKPFLSVIIPSYNEGSNIKRGVLDRVVKYLEKQDYTYEVILSDDGSTDNSPQKLEAFAKKHKYWRFLANDHAGKGPTVASGMLAAKGKWRLFTDFDQSTPMNELENLLPFTNEYDLVIGSRAIEGAKREKEPFYRHLMGLGFNVLTQLIALPGIQDSQCGFKLMSEKATTSLFPKLYIYSRDNAKKDAFTGAFDVELLHLARKENFKIKEVGVSWHHNKTERVDPIKDSMRMLTDIIRVRMADLTGKYNR
ncbi:MAG: glycosyltransferase [Pseudomonadales bacterium]|jgi:glycosyltransferase involved in cell wall biosynthesis|nr:glycosyltransferase [Pseudomonadales bacterium]